MPLTSISNSSNMRNSTNKQNSYQLCYEGEQNKSPRKFTQMSPLRKLNNVQTQQSNIVNQLKIKLADKQFELKKLEQDQSVKYTQIVKELQKQKLQKKQIIKQWKQKLQEEIEYWNMKIQNVKKQYQKKFIEKNQQENQSVQKKMQEQKNFLERKFDEELKKLENILEKTKIQYEKEIQQLKADNNKQIQKVTLQHKQALQSLRKQLTQQIQSLKTAHNKQILFYNQLQQTKSKQTKAVQKIFSNKIKTLQQQLVFKIGQIRQLNQQLSSKNSQIESINRQKQNYRLDNICLQRKYKKLSSDLQGQFDGRFDQIKIQYEKMYKIQSQKFVNELQIMKKMYQQCKQKYQNQIKLKDQRAENLLMIFNTSKSKQQDLKRIQMLQTKLCKKQLELQKQREDLKICRLQLNNMDQLFQKMFQQAKLKSSKTKKLRLPSLMAKNLVNRSTMDVYEENLRIQKEKEKQKNRQKKFSIRDYSYQTMAKQVKQLKSQLNVEL